MLALNFPCLTLRVPDRFPALFAGCWVEVDAVKSSWMYLCYCQTAHCCHRDVGHVDLTDNLLFSPPFLSFCIK